jgi:gliding motility-associated-like protein
MKLKLLFIAVIIQGLLSATAVRGQFCAKGGGGFSITPGIGCVGEVVNITNEVPTAKNLSYAFNFNRTQLNEPDTKDVTETPSYVYTKPGAYTILQYGSLNGTGVTACKDFTVRETRQPEATLTVCENGIVRLTIVNDTIAKAFDQISIDWGDGSAKEIWTLPIGKNLIVPHLYKTANTPPIILAGKYADGSCQQVMNPRVISGAVTPPSLAKIRITGVEMVADGNARIVYQGMDGINTQVLVDNGDGIFVETQKGTSTAGAQSVMIADLNPETVYKFKLSSRNLCDNLVESSVVNSIVVKSVETFADETNSLVWTAYSNPAELIQYQLLRDGVVIHETKELSYIDAGVKCGEKYKYEVVAIVQNDVRSYSAPIEVEPKSSAPDIIETANVTVSAGNQIETTVALGGAGLTGTYDLVIEKSVAGSSAWEKVSGANNQSLTFEDKNVNTAENSYCYRFSYTNACKLSSPEFSQPVCSILLSSNAADLTWTSATPVIGGVGSFGLVQMDQAGAVQDEKPMGLTNTYSVALDQNPATTFQVKAYSLLGNFTSHSNILNFSRDVVLKIPDAFTPNADDWNKKFEVKSYFTSAFQLSIYNRWGVMIFQTKDSKDGWDGNDEKGSQLPPGYYIYKVDVEDMKGKQFSRSGGLLLIR